MASQGIHHAVSLSSVLEEKIASIKMHFMVDLIERIDFTSPFHKYIILTHAERKEFVITTVQETNFLSALEVVIALTLNKSQRCFVVVSFHSVAEMLLNHIVTAFKEVPNLKVLHVEEQGTKSLKKSHILLCTPEAFSILIREKGVLNKLGTVIWVDPHAYSEIRAATLEGVRSRAQWIRKLKDRRQVFLCRLPNVPIFGIGQLTCNEDYNIPENKSGAIKCASELNLSQTECALPIIRDTKKVYLPDMYLCNANFSRMKDYLSKVLKKNDKSVILFARKKYVEALQDIFAGKPQLTILVTRDVWLNHSADIVLMDYHPFIDNNTLFRAALCAEEELLILASQEEHGFPPNPTLAFLANYRYGDISLDSDKRDVLEHLSQTGVIHPKKYFFITLLVALFRTQRTLNELYDVLCRVLLWGTSNSAPPLSRKMLQILVNKLCDASLIYRVGGRYSTTAEGLDVMKKYDRKLLDVIYLSLFGEEKIDIELRDTDYKSYIEGETWIEAEDQKYASIEKLDEREKNRIGKKLVLQGYTPTQFSKTVSQGSFSDPTHTKTRIMKGLIQRSRRKRGSFEKYDDEEKEIEKRDYKRIKGSPTPLTSKAINLIDKMVYDGVSHPSEIASKTGIAHSTVRTYLEQQVRKGKFRRVEIRGKRGRPPIHYKPPFDDKNQDSDICRNCAHYTKSKYCALASHLYKHGELPSFLKGRNRMFPKVTPYCSEFVSKEGIFYVKEFRVTMENGSLIYYCARCDESINIYTRPLKCAQCGTIYKEIKKINWRYKAYIDRKDALRTSFRKLAGFDLQEDVPLKKRLQIRKGDFVVLKEDTITVNNKPISLLTIKSIYAEKGVLDDDIIKNLRKNHIFVKEVEVSSRVSSQKKRSLKQKNPTKKQQDAVIRSRSALIQPMSVARILNEINVTYHLNALLLQEHTNTSDNKSFVGDTLEKREHMFSSSLINRVKKQWDEIYRILQTQDEDFIYYYRLAEARATKEKWGAFREVISHYYPWVDRVGARFVLEPQDEPYGYTRAYSEIHADINYLHKHITFATQDLLDKLSLPAQGLTGILHTSDFVYDVGDSFKTHIQLFLAKNILTEHMKREYHYKYYGKWETPVYTLNGTGVYILNQFLNEFWEQQVYYNGIYMSMQEAHELWTKKVLHAIKTSETIDPLELVITYSQEEFEKIKERYQLFNKYVEYIQLDTNV